MLVAVGVSVGRAIAVAVISAITVARMSGVRVGVWVTVGVGVGVGVSVGSGVDVAVGETAMSETSSGSGDGEGVGGSQLRQRASARARATGFHSLVVFTRRLFGCLHHQGQYSTAPVLLLHMMRVKRYQSPSPQPPYRGTGQALFHQGRGGGWLVGRHVYGQSIDFGGGKKFFEKTRPSGPSGPHQSCGDFAVALSSGALSRNHSCPLSAPWAPVSGVSSTSRMPLNSLRPWLLSVLILKMSQMEP